MRNERSKSKLVNEEQLKATLVYMLALSQFSTPFMFSGVGITLPVLGRELQASGVQLGLIEIIYLGAASAFLLPVGRFADMTDRNIIFKLGLFTYAITTLILGFQSLIPIIIGLRFIQGLAGALVMATNMAILTAIVPKEKLGKAVGINIGAVYLGLSAGPFIAGWITTYWGWRWVFYCTSIPLVLSFILIHFNLKSNWKRPENPFDWYGTLMIVASIFFLISGSALIGRSPAGYLLSLLGVGFIVLFFFLENRLPNPLLSISKIRKNSVMSIALLIQLLMYSGAFGISFLFSLYLQTNKGLTPREAGQIMVISPIVMAIFAPICGRLADRYPPRILTSIGLAFSLISTLAAIFVDSDTGLVYLIGVLVFQGLGFAVFSSPNMAIIMNSVMPREYGLASALSAKMRSLGMVLSMMIITIFMSIYIGQHMLSANPASFLVVMRYSFIIFTISAALGTLLSLKKPSKAVNTTN